MNLNIAFVFKPKGHFIHLVIIRSTSDWTDFVIKELAKGGGSLFKYINKEDKEFLNVDYTNVPGTDADPDIFLTQQTTQWSTKWCPHPNSEEHLKTAAHARAYREIFMANPDTTQSEPKDLKLSIDTYPKESKEWITGQKQN